MSLPSPRPRCPTAPRACRRSRPCIAALAALALSATLLATAQAKDEVKDTVKDTVKTAAQSGSVFQSSTGTQASAAAQVGVASIYSRKLVGRRMANGAPLRIDRHYAASTMLPLGSTALVTNLANGKRAIVTITDRGPFVRGRIIDLTPHTAMQLGIGGLGKVEVARIAPLKDGRDSGELVLVDAARNENWPPR